MEQTMIEKIRNYGFGEFITYIFERKLKIRLPISSELRWEFNIKSEIRFWDNWFRTNGLEWPEEYLLRLDKNRPLQSEILKLIPEKESVDILDVGAGPLTYIGKIFEKAILNITAVDALADEYDKLLLKYNLNPNVRTTKLNAEELTTKFDENSFDFVFARNSIDHCYSPEKAVQEMIRVVKIGHYVLMVHRPNEAKKENWRGLHQWNFDSSSDDFIISTKSYRINISEKYSTICTTKCEYDKNEDMLHVRLLKK